MVVVPVLVFVTLSAGFQIPEVSPKSLSLTSRNEKEHTTERNTTTHFIRETSNANTPRSPKNTQIPILASNVSLNRTANKYNRKAVTVTDSKPEKCKIDINKGETLRDCLDPISTDNTKNTKMTTRVTEDIGLRIIKPHSTFSNIDKSSPKTTNSVTQSPAVTKIFATIDVVFKTEKPVTKITTATKSSVYKKTIENSSRNVIVDFFQNIINIESIVSNKLDNIIRILNIFKKIKKFFEKEKPTTESTTESIANTEPNNIVQPVNEMTIRTMPVERFEVTSPPKSSKITENDLKNIGSSRKFPNFYRHFPVKRQLPLTEHFHDHNPWAPPTEQPLEYLEDDMLPKAVHQHDHSKLSLEPPALPSQNAVLKLDQNTQDLLSKILESNVELIDTAKGLLEIYADNLKKTRSDSQNLNNLLEKGINLFKNSLASLEPRKLKEPEVTQPIKKTKKTFKLSDMIKALTQELKKDNSESRVKRQSNEQETQEEVKEIIKALTELFQQSKTSDLYKMMETFLKSGTDFFNQSTAKTGQKSPTKNPTTQLLMNLLSKAIELLGERVPTSQPNPKHLPAVPKSDSASININDLTKLLGHVRTKRSFIDEDSNVDRSMEELLYKSMSLLSKAATSSKDSPNDTSSNEPNLSSANPSSLKILLHQKNEAKPAMWRRIMRLPETVLAGSYNFLTSPINNGIAGLTHWIKLIRAGGK